MLYTKSPRIHALGTLQSCHSIIYRPSASAFLSPHHCMLIFISVLTAGAKEPTPDLMSGSFPRSRLY